MPSTPRLQGALALLLAPTRGPSFRRVRRLWSAELVTVGALVLSGIVVARALGPAEYGRFALLSAFGALVYTFLEPRAGEIVTKYFGTAVAERRSRDARVVLRGVITLDLVAGAVAVGLTVAARPLASSIAPGTWADVALAAAAAALAGSIVTGRAVLAVLDRYRQFARLQTGFGILRAAASSAAAVVAADATTVLAALAATSALEVVATAVVARRAVRLKHARLSDEPGTHLREFMVAAPGVGRFLGYSEATTLLASLPKHADILVVGAVAGPEQAGFYRLARSLTAPVANLTTPLQTVTFNRMVSENVAGGVARVLAVGRRAAVTTLPLALALALLATLIPWVVRVLAGQAYAGAAPAAVVLLLGAAVGLPFYWLRSMYLVLDRLRSWLVVSVVTSTAATAAFFVGAEQAGALGVAVARVLAVMLIANLVLVALLRVAPHRRLARATPRAHGGEG